MGDQTDLTPERVAEHSAVLRSLSSWLLTHDFDIQSP